MNVLRTHIAVIGGGGSGLSAALAAATAGAHVTLVDDQVKPGGRIAYARALAEGDSPAAQMVSELSGRTGVNVIDATSAWGIFPSGEVAVNRGVAPLMIRANRIILATGTTDLPLMVPGWQLPGVMTARAAAILVNRHGVLPGRNLVVLGDDILAERAAEPLAAGGADVVVIHRVGPVEIEIEGEGRVEAVRVGDKRYPADCVVLAAGTQPDIQLALMAECAATWDSARGAWQVDRDADGMTSVPGIYICGSAAGVEPVMDAALDGVRVGASAAALLHAEIELTARQRGEDSYQQPWRPSLLGAARGGE